MKKEFGRIFGRAKKSCVIWCMVIMSWMNGALPVIAQDIETGDSIRINPKFMKELESAFSFDPVRAPVKVPNDVLTRELLHEWVGPVDGGKPKEISIPGLGGFTDGLQHYGKHWHSTKEGGMGCTLDVNALAKFIRPSEIRLRKMRALAESAKGKMDILFPIEKRLPESNTDTLALSRR